MKNELVCSGDILKHILVLEERLRKILDRVLILKEHVVRILDRVLSQEKRVPNILDRVLTQEEWIHKILDCVLILKECLHEILEHVPVSAMRNYSAKCTTPEINARKFFCFNKPTIYNNTRPFIINSKIS